MALLPGIFAASRAARQTHSSGTRPCPACRHVEEMLTKALAALSESISARNREHRSGTTLVEAMQASPNKEIELEPQRYRLPVRELST
jgi:hypothetical protein